MERTWDLPDALAEDLDRLKHETERFKGGEASPAEFRSFRVPQGVYEQRRHDTFMLRVRLPAGGMLPDQMRTIAAVSREHGNGILHVTSRQDIQVHDVLLDSIHPALVQLYAASLSTKGGGGNTVRNITACYDAGVCAREAFDVSPYAIALTEFLLRDPASYQLPRKYKIAFSGCAEDCAGVTVNDLGLTAKRRGDQLGFAVCVGGGMGARSRVADPLEEFVPGTDIHLVAEAVKRVFDKHGNRRDRHRARLRFLIGQIGFDSFRELYEAELAELRSAGLPPLDIRDLRCARGEAPESGPQPSDGFALWQEANVTPQKQDGYCLVQIPLRLGDIAAGTLEELADVVAEHGEGMIRTTQWQNLVLRWVHRSELAALHQKLSGLGLAEAPAPIVRDTVACAGASTCRLGVCLSRGLARAVADRLDREGLDLGGCGELDLHISGCPNACGRHPIGRIGLFGAARRVGGKLVPHYVVQLGGRTGQGATRLAEGTDTISAREVPEFIADFLRAFRASDQYPDYDAFLEAGGRETASRCAADHKHVPTFEEDKNYYYDWGADELFSLAGRGPGECGAGVFDLIEVDLASAHEALGQGRLFSATVLAASALLVTQGQEAKTALKALDLFDKYFLQADLVSHSFQPLIDEARRSAAATVPDDAFGGAREQVSAFAEAIQGLYDGMDQSLRFQPAAAPSAPKPQPEPLGQIGVAKEADFHGVACPLNYMKTKLLLDQVESGEVVSVLVDEEAMRSVPASAEKDGHQVLSITEEGTQWRLLIRKG